MWDESHPVASTSKSESLWLNYDEKDVVQQIKYSKKIKQTLSDMNPVVKKPKREKTFAEPHVQLKGWARFDRLAMTSLKVYIVSVIVLCFFFSQQILLNLTYTFEPLGLALLFLPFSTSMFLIFKPLVLRAPQFKYGVDQQVTLSQMKKLEKEAQ